MDLYAYVILHFSAALKKAGAVLVFLLVLELTWTLKWKYM